MNGGCAELRGRTYASVYAPSNQRYPLESDEKVCDLARGISERNEWRTIYRKATVVQNGDSFKAEIFVPVWTSQLYVSDWWQPSEVPLRPASARRRTAGKNVDNRSEQKLTDAQIVIDQRVFRLGRWLLRKRRLFSC